MDERLFERIPEALEKRCAHLAPDPFLSQKVLRAACGKEQPIVKSKMRWGLVLALILMLLSVTAVAAVILSGMQIVEETAVPMAKKNDGGELRPNEDYSAEELEALIRVAAENGIILDDDTSIMQAFRRGEGYSEEETIMAICREAFGGLYFEWTIEQRHWFQEMMIAIGWSSENNVALPEAPNMPSEQARQLARETVWKHYGADIPVNDPTKYRMNEEYNAPMLGTQYGTWEFRFVAQDIHGTNYYITMDGAGEWVDHASETPDWTEYTEIRLMNALTDLYSTTSLWSTMEQEAWAILSEMLPGATHSPYWSMEYDAFLKTTYVRPESGDMDKNALRQLIQKRLGDKAGTRLYAVLIELDGRHVWRATANTVDEAGKDDKYVYYEVDAVTGEILSEVQKDFQRALWANFVPERVYQELLGDSMTPDTAIDLAIEALYAEYGDDTIPFRDENCYEIACSSNGSGTSFGIMFNPKELGYGRSSIQVYCETGEVRIWFANPMGITPDNLFKAYDDVYGTNMNWEQSMWMGFSQHLATLEGEPVTFEGKLFRQTVYADDSQVAISKSKACDIAVLDSGDVTNSIIRCILIEAEPNPVWKIRVSSYPVSSLYEIDAMTGEVLDKEWYIIQDDANIDHTMKMYTLRSTFMPVYLEEYGMARVAMEYIVKTRLGPDGPINYTVFMDDDSYYVQVDGMTVTFAGLNSTSISYRVTLGENALTAQVEVLTDVTELLKAAPEGSIAWAVGTYGTDRTAWPEGQEGREEPHPGDMSEAEAIAHAKAELIKVVGQEAYDALGEAYIDVERTHFFNGGDCTRWTVRFISQESMENPNRLMKGWRVTFSQRDGEIWTEPDIKDINDKSNG